MTMDITSRATKSKSSALVGLAAAAMLAIALPGAAFAQDDTGATPEGATWSLTAYSVDGAETAVPENVEASLRMEDGEATGNGGCNAFFGTYELDGADLSFAGEVGSTMMMCEPDAQAVEDAYLPLLGGVTTWAMDSNVLSLSDASGAAVLTFEEPIVDIFETDIEALNGELARLDNRINNTRADVRQLDVPGLRTDVEALTVEVADIAKRQKNQNVPGLRDRVIANEEALVSLNKRVEKNEARLDAIEKELGIQN
jgi:heat shock protein HslJ